MTGRRAGTRRCYAAPCGSRAQRDQRRRPIGLGCRKRSRSGQRCSSGRSQGAGRFRVERGPDGLQVSDARGFPIPQQPSTIPRELLTGRYAELWESADRPRAFLASGELGFLHRGSGGGVKPATTGAATQTGAEPLCLRSGRCITTPQLHWV
eukprot:3437250-Rhodomonas_salina.2